MNQNFGGLYLLLQPFKTGKLLSRNVFRNRMNFQPFFLQSQFFLDSQKNRYPPKNRLKQQLLSKNSSVRFFGRKDINFAYYFVKINRARVYGSIIYY